MTGIWPIAVGGTILAVGPILIHLLFRWRYRVVHFAAFRFLLEGRRRIRQRLRLEELILVALRVLACILLGLTLADVRSAAVRAGDTTPAVHVFILDDSLSMGQVVRGESIHQRAVEDLCRELADMPAADSLAVISASRPGTGDPLGRLLAAEEARRGDLVARLRGSKPTDLRADYPAALRSAAKLIGSRDRAPAHVHLLGDFRSDEFGAGEAAGAVRSAAGELPQGVRLRAMDFGSPARGNLAVERITPLRSIVVAGVSTPLRAVIRNAGEEPSSPSRLEVSLGEVALPVLPVPALAPGATAHVDFACTFDAPGSAWVRVSLPADDLPGDNTVALALEAQGALRILIVDGSPNPSDPRSASYALGMALDPSGKGAFARRVEVQPAATWSPASVPSYDVVILANVRDFPAGRGDDGKGVYPHVKALEDYVRNGGGLAIFAGESLSVPFYNGPMFAEGHGLSPLPLADVPTPRPDPSIFARLDPQSVRSAPMLRAYASDGAGLARFLRFYAYVSATPRDGESGPEAPQVLARFDNGLPAVCRRGLGKGQVVMWYTSPDTNWSNWPKDLSFLAAMNDMAWDLARAAENTFDDLAGRSIGYTLPQRYSGTLSAVLKTPAYPDEDVHALAIQDDGRQQTVLHPQPPHAGLYELTLMQRDRSEHRILFSRHPDARESLLAKATEADVRAALGEPSEYIARATAGAPPAPADPSTGSLWRIALAVLAGILLLETFLGLRFGHYLRRGQPASAAPAEGSP
jgi:hypothetical protein